MNQRGERVRYANQSHNDKKGDEIGQNAGREKMFRVHWKIVSVRATC
jgi:hypothetical protein